MAKLNVCTEKIIENIRQINDLMEQYGKKWSLISKVLSGNKKVLNAIANSGELERIHSIGDSRLSGLKAVKEVNPDIITMYIKPPAINYAEEVIEYADISMNTSIETMTVLNEFAKQKGKFHKSIIMIEMGELREGILHENVVDFYSKVFELSNIEIVGLGTNLGCMYGIEPTFDKLLQLSLYKQLIEIKFNQSLEIISGGTSITLPLIEKGKVPKEVNHFRIGEAAFLGVSPLNNQQFNDLHTDAFHVEATIVEIEEKKNVPEGILSDANVGHTNGANSTEDTTSFKALVDIGILDVNIENIDIDDDDISFVGTTSDITVFDLGENMDDKGIKRYKVGDSITFSPSYMGVARLMSSKYIEKDIQCNETGDK